MAGSGDSLPDYGLAPEFDGIEGWLNSEPLTLERLRGRVVLIDFWTYSCVNCLRTLPFVTEWDSRYRGSGLTIVGVHSPEFAFEREEANVRENVGKLGIEYPIALDNGFRTWSAWSNQYWPAKYLIDREGHVRYYHFGEGDYDETEEAIRELLARRGTSVPMASGLEDDSPRGRVTPESYLGYERLARYAGTPVVQDREASYVLPAALADNQLSYDGRWTVEDERAVAAPAHGCCSTTAPATSSSCSPAAARSRCSWTASASDASAWPATGCTHSSSGDEIADHVLELRVSPGVAAYAFTFG